MPSTAEPEKDGYINTSSVLIASIEAEITIDSPSPTSESVELMDADAF